MRIAVSICCAFSSRAFLSYSSCVIRHEWSEGDLVIWDNRAALHRATPYDTTRHARLMQRTTISTGVPSRV